MKLRGSYTLDQFSREFPHESDEVEFKTGLGQNPLQEALVALSNTRGGVVLVGVQNDGTVDGKKRDQGTDERIHSAAGDAREVGRYRILEVNVGTRPVVAVLVEKREEGFAQTSDGRILVRRGARNTALFGSDLRRFVTERALRRFESSPTELTVAQADAGLLNEVRAAFGWRGRASFNDRLRERGMLTIEGNLSIAGALFLTDPRGSLRQNKAIVEVRRYPESGANYDRREEFGGPLHHQVREATRFLMDELGSDVVVTGLYRHELPRIPEVVIREAIANAVAHRSYEIHRVATVVDLFPDRIVVSSPGGLPEPVTVENIRQAQAARNQDVIDVLRRFRLAEDAGRGVDVMQDSMAEALLDPPTFEDVDYSVRVTLPLRGPITSRERAWVADLERRGAIHGSDRLLLVHAARGERLTNAAARHILSSDRTEARQALVRLRDAGLLTQQGARGGASYSLIEEIAPPAAFRMTSEQVELLVLDRAAEGPISNEIVRAITGLERRAALALLRKLVFTKKLRKRGDRRGTRYVLR